MDRNNFRTIPADLWEMLEPMIPPDPSRARGGRERIAARRILGGILYRLRTGCQWKAIPRNFAPGSTVHRRFQEWVELGVFETIFEVLVRYYDDLRGIDWKWCSLDGAMVKAPKGGTLPVRIRRIVQNQG
jgi:putative transposase